MKPHAIYVMVVGVLAAAFSQRALAMSPESILAGLTQPSNGANVQALYTRIDALDSKIQKNPTDALSHHERGVFKLQIKDLEGALADFNRAIELNPKDFKSYYFRGLIRQTKGDLLGAISDYERELELENNPRQFLARFLLGEAKLARDDWDGAMAAFRDADQADKLRLRSQAKNAASGLDQK
jgi:tetratricopeptide (TPR) repeat protein